MRHKNFSISLRSLSIQGLHSSISISNANHNHWSVSMALSIPNSLVEAGRRMKHNFWRFRSEYAIFILFLFLLSVFGQSFPMVILINFVFVCFLLYLYDPDPNRLVVLSNCCTTECIAFFAVLGVLSIWTLILIAGVRLNALVSISIGCALAGLHAVFRGTEDLMHLDRHDQKPEDRQMVDQVLENPTPTASYLADSSSCS